MAEADWTFLTNSLTEGSVRRGVTAGFTPPDGGGSFMFGLSAISATAGAVGLFANQTNFAPIDGGGSIRGALQRASTASDTGWSAFMFIGLEGSAVTDVGYLLGLSDANPSRLILRKGTVQSGIPDDTPNPASNGNLLASTNTFAKGTWVHVRLDWIVNDNGDVILQVFQNDLDTNDVTSPVWDTVDGMEGTITSVDGFVDDVLQVNSGSAPISQGRAGVAGQFSGTGRRALFDHVQVARVV